MRIEIEKQVLVRERTRLSGFVAALPTTRWEPCGEAFFVASIHNAFKPGASDRIIMEAMDPGSAIRTPCGYFHVTVPIRRGTVALGGFCGGFRVRTLEEPPVLDSRAPGQGEDLDQHADGYFGG